MYSMFIASNAGHLLGGIEMERVLQTSALTKTYKGYKAINEVNITIERGDIYGFVGENGAGKTTLIRLITGLTMPTSGTYQLFDSTSETSEIRNARRRLSAVVESPSIATNMTAYDNLKMQAYIIGLTDLSFIDHVLEVTGLEYLKASKKMVKHVLLGMKQRLGIAIALLGHPDFIILDEPMNGLDPEGIVEMRELILKLNREQNITFLISSHILEELSRVATKYGFLHKGKLVQEISKEALEEQCQKCIAIVVDKPERIPQIVEQVLKTENYKLLNGNEVRLYGEVDIAKAVRALDDGGIHIETINTKNESIEEYYLNLMGGLQHV